MFFNLILFLVILALLYWATMLLPLPEPFPRIIQVLFVLVAVLAFLTIFNIHIAGFTVPRLI